MFIGLRHFVRVLRFRSLSYSHSPSPAVSGLSSKRLFVHHQQHSAKMSSSSSLLTPSTFQIAAVRRVQRHTAWSNPLFTQRRSVAKSVGCFQRRLFVCQHDNFRTSKHRMMKLGGRCIEHKSRPSSNLGVIAPWVRTPKM